MTSIVDGTLRQAHVLVLASNAVLLVWGLLEGWRITHLVWPFLVESVIVAGFAMFHIMRGTLRRDRYTINGGAPKQAHWPRVVTGLRAFNFCFIGVFLMGLFAIFLAVFQPIAFPRASDAQNPLRLLGVLVIVGLLIQRHYLLYRRRRARDGHPVMDLTGVVQTYRRVLVAWVGLGLLVVFAVVLAESAAEVVEILFGERWRHVVDILLLVAAIIAKTRYEWWMEASEVV